MKRAGTERTVRDYTSHRSRVGLRRDTYRGIGG